MFNHINSIAELQVAYADKKAKALSEKKVSKQINSSSLSLQLDKISAAYANRAQDIILSQK